MKLIVGLGNPGLQYENTRHNTGFLAIDKLAEKLNIAVDRKAFSGLIGKTMINGEQIILLKPQTFMNLSGESVQKAASYYHLNYQEDILIIYDDLDLPYGKIRLRPNGSAGGHNGIKSIIANLNTSDFKRIRVGIDKDPNIPVIDYVLGKVPKEQKEDWLNAIAKAAQAANEFPNTSFDKLMNKYNVKEKNG